MCDLDSRPPVNDEHRPFWSHMTTPGFKSVVSIDADGTPGGHGGEGGWGWGWWGLGRAIRSLSKSIAELIGTEELLPSAPPPPSPLLRSADFRLFELPSMGCFSLCLKGSGKRMRAQISPHLSLNPVYLVNPPLMRYSHTSTQRKTHVMFPSNPIESVEASAWC